MAEKVFPPVLIFLTGNFYICLWPLFNIKMAVHGQGEATGKDFSYLHCFKHIPEEGDCDASKHSIIAN